ncbi:MAG: hypothetical protein HY275_17460, partial [Gemmatimonadetes bacterium]|nr:hypothetical protein [Gemmatimonadota bacterium]
GAAHHALAEARAMLAGVSDTGSAILLARGEAVLAAHEGRWAVAVEAARRVFALVGAQPPTAYYWAEAYAAAAMVLARAAAAGSGAVTRAEVDLRVKRVRGLARNFWNLRDRIGPLEAAVADIR